MQCNIDARGKRLRLISGVVFIAAGLIALAAAAAVGGSWLWIVGGVALAIGAFQVFEARAGWCVLRAMGVRTKI